MLRSGPNPYHDVLQTYEDLCAMLAFRYGPDAQGLVFVLYDQLITLRRLQTEETDSLVLRAWIVDVARRLRQRYHEQPVAADLDHPTAVVGTDPEILEYSRERFEMRYRSVADIVQRETVELTGPVLPSAFVTGRPYMYVIDDEGRFMVWSRSFSFEELVFGRNRATVDGVAVGHPMLVPERLRARAAGEIVFIGTPRVRAVIVNNKSGHFRFPTSSRDVIEDCCRRILHLPDDAIDIFVVGGFHPDRVRRTLVPTEHPERAGAVAS
jgi:hypothetical protein